MPVRLSKEFVRFRQHNLLLRKASVELYKKLAAGDSSLVIVDGVGGVGKSAVGLQIADLLLANNHFLFYIPNTVYATGGYFAYYPAENGTFDQPELALRLLQITLNLNSRLFESAELLEWKSKLESATVDNAMTVCLSLIDFVAAQTLFKAYFIFDDFTALFSQTEYRDTTGKQLSPNKLNLLRPFVDLVEGKRSLSSGSVVALHSYYNTEAVFPNWKSRVGEHSLVTIAPFSREETKLVLQYYKDIGLVYDQISDSYASRKQFLSNGIGYFLFQACQYDNIY